MEEINFKNKLWVSMKGGIFERFLAVLVCIYCILQIFVFFMEGIDFRSVIMIVLAVVLFVYCIRRLKGYGKYIESLCVLKFFHGRLVWEYPNMITDKGSLHIVYDIEEKRVKDIEVCYKLNSVRVISQPVMTVEYWSQRKKITDFSKKNKDCFLVLYYDDIESMVQLFQKYFNCVIQIVD